MLYAGELERLSLWTRKAVAVLVVCESVLVIWVFEEPLPCLWHHHLLTSPDTLCHMARGEIPGVSQRHRHPRPGRLFGLLNHRRQQGIVSGRIHHVHGGDQHAGCPLFRLHG